MKKVFIILFLILLGSFIYIFNTYKELKYYEEILQDIDIEEVDINSYSIFGTSLNMEGCINKILNSPSLVLKNKEEEIIINSNFYVENNNTCFNISEYNNKGINLDVLKLGDFILLIKDNDIYYTLNNKTNYKDIEYYTITKNNINNKININFKKYNEINYVNFIIKEEKLPDNVYDITIDPGHGGKDPGAIGNLNGIEYYESDLTLSVSLRLKEELEKKGLKVKLTRDSDIYVTPYGDSGRAAIPNESKSKYSLSIHFNSDYGIMKYGGVEVYTPNNIDYSLATLFANKLSNIVGYSKNSNFKVSDGVYYKYFKQKDIDNSKESILEEEMIPYDITLNCPYMYMIREVGGIHTFAYIDDRNLEYGVNKYYNSNITAEPYLLELAYINYPPDLELAINNKEAFSKAISEAIFEYLDI